MVLTRFKQEPDAATNPPTSFFSPTLAPVHARCSTPATITPFLLNSLMASVVSTLLVLLLAVPAAYALSIRPVRQVDRRAVLLHLHQDAAGGRPALLPIYLIVKQLGMLDNIWTLVILYTSMNLPIAVWMMRSFLLEVPEEILEAAQVDGAGLLTRAAPDRRCRSSRPASPPPR